CSCLRGQPPGLRDAPRVLPRRAPSRRRVLAHAAGPRDGARAPGAGGGDKFDLRRKPHKVRSAIMTNYRNAFRAALALSLLLACGMAFLLWRWHAEHSTGGAVPPSEGSSAATSDAQDSG